MKSKEFAQLIRDGLKPVVTFNKLVEDQEGYAEAGMRARVIGVQFDHDGVIKFKVDYSEFDEFNKQYEPSNYYDTNQVPCLNARQAGCYEQVDTIYTDADFDVCFDIEESNRLKVYEKYKSSGSNLSYVQWLEDKVTRMMETVGLEA